MSLPEKKIKKIKLPGDVSGSQTYEIVPDKLSDGSTNYKATLPTLTEDSTIALTKNIPTNADYVDLTTNQNVDGVKSFNNEPIIEWDRTPYGAATSNLQKIDYLIFRGTDYVQPDLHLTESTEYSLDLDFTSLGSGAYGLLGNYDQTKYLVKNTAANNIQLYYTASPTTVSPGFTTNTRYLIEFKGKKLYLDNTSIIDYSSETVTFDVYPILIGNRYTTGSTTNGLTGKLYGVTITQSGVVHTFTPCYEKTTNTVGLFDSLGIFYPVYTYGVAGEVKYTLNQTGGPESSGDIECKSTISSYIREVALVQAKTITWADTTANGNTSSGPINIGGTLNGASNDNTYINFGTAADPTAKTAFITTYNGGFIMGANGQTLYFMMNDAFRPTSNANGATLKLGNSTRAWNSLYLSKNGQTSSDAGAIVFNDTYLGTVKHADLTAARDWTLPNKTGTVALTSDIPSVSNNTITIHQDGISSDQTFTLNGSATTISLLDTKNTTGTSAADDSTKLYLVGAAQQAANYTTETNAKVYEQNGKLYSNNSEVINLADTQTITGAKVFAQRPALEVTRLPAEYQEVDCAEALTAGPYINTGLAVHMGWKYKLIFQQNTAQTRRIWGAFNQAAYNGGFNTSLTYGSNAWMIRWETVNGQTHSVDLPRIDTQKHTLYIDNGEVYFDGIDQGKSAAHDATAVSNYPAFLFTINPGGTAVSNPMEGKIYSYQVWDDSGDLVQDLVPCRRKLDGTVGFYDLVNDNFLSPIDGTLTSTVDVVDSTFLVAADLSSVATSGDYNDLANKPAIPTVNNATLTIQKNGTTVQTFTANASTDVTANITVPTSDSDLTNNKYVRYDANTQGLNDTQKSNARTNIGAGTSNLTLGNTASTAAAGNHTHTTSISSEGSNPTSLSANTTYTLTAGGSSVVFKTPTDTNTTYTFAEGETNGKFTVTPSGGSASSVTVHGLNNAAYKGVSTTISSSSTDDDLATAKAVYTAINDLPEPMVFKGSLGTGGTITTLPAAAASNEGFTYKVITDGTYASQAAKVGDTFICAKTGTSTFEWILIPSGDEPNGTVTSVAIRNGSTSQNTLTISGSPITSSGTIDITLKDNYGDTKNPYAAKHANYVLAGPESGNNAAPTFRALVKADIPLASETAASGGTTTSLVTTGEKYTWNNKYTKPAGGIPDSDLAGDYVTIGDEQTVTGHKIFSIRPSLTVTRLPDTYQELESITLSVSDSSYINTELVITDTENLYFKLDAKYNGDNPNFATLFGYMAQSTTPRCAVSVYNNKYMIGINTTTSSIDNYTTSRALYEFYTSGSNQYLALNNSIIVQTSYTSGALSENTLPIYVGARNTGGTANNFSGLTVYSFYVRASGETHNFIPCKRLSDNKLGLYDLSAESNQFKAVSGTAIAGRDVTDSDFLVATDLATVATSGNYNDLVNKPSISNTWRNIKVEGTQFLGSAISTGAVNFKAGSNTTITTSTANSSNDIIITATDTNTASAADDILQGSNSGTQIKYAPYTLKGAGHLYKHSDAPSDTTAYVKYDGKFYATEVYAGSTKLTGNTGTITSVKTTAGTHTTIDVSNGAANFNVPTKTSHLTNDSNFVTSSGVTEVTAGAGLNTTSNDTATDGGTITTTGTIYLTKSGVTAGTYQGITVDKYGRVTEASNQGYVTSSGVTSIATSGTGLSGGPITSTGTINLDSSAAGNRTVDQVVIAAANGQINSEKLAITSGTTVKATIQYDSTDDAIKFIFA